MIIEIMNIEINAIRDTKVCSLFLNRVQAEKWLKKATILIIKNIGTIETYDPL